MPKIYINYKLILYIILSIFALILRFLDLSDRAVHHDESLHGFFSFITSQGDYYNHNPLTHGMFLFNTLSSFFWLFTDNNYILRLPFAIFGFLLIFIPLLLRKELGFIPCYIFSIFLTISPSIAYFSRFARNDIFMAFFLLIFIISIIKYVKSSQNLWIYISVACLSIGYTIKESMYINVLGLLIFLFFYSFNDIKNVILGKISIDKITNETMIFIIIFTLSLPLSAPLVSIFQSSLGFTLATPDGYPGVPPGLPTGLGIIVSWIISIFLLIISLFIGISTDKKIYLISLLIFSLIYIFMFTTFLVAPQGLVTGQWQSLGYWLAQHEVARGSQPYYYYFLILITNEFLPFLVGLPLSLYYLFQKSFLKRIIGFWSIFCIIAFSIAGEKMPWLTVNITLPLIFALSIFSKDLLAYIIKIKYPILIFYFVTTSILSIFILKILFSDYTDSSNIYYDLLYLISSFILFILFFIYTKESFKFNLLFYSFIVIISLFGTLLTIRTTNNVIFKLSDNPKDMLIYTQTSQELHKISLEIEELQIKKSNISIAVDSTDGFSWPWMWYQRNNNKITWFSDMDYERLQNDYDLMLVNNKNLDKIDLVNYKVIREFPHREWFPENIYRNKNLADLTKFFMNTQERIKFKNFILYRDFESSIGSSDGTFLKSKNLENIE